MKILKQAKLLALIPFVTLALGCESKEPKSTQQENTTVKEDVHTPSVLSQQIKSMLAGKTHNETILKAEITKLEWKKTFTALKEEIKAYTSQHGKRPEKKLIAITHARLSRINAQVDLEKAKRANKQSLDEFEKAIQKAIEKEKAQKASH